MLNEELKQKLCLNISNEFDAKLSWCAILCCWVELCKIADELFDAYYKYLIDHKDKIENDFYSAVNGK